jgi:hypothetical protein
MRWKLHTHFGKSWHKSIVDEHEGYLQYEIQLLPSVSLFYDSVMVDVEDRLETSQLTVQWLIWYFAIWFTKEVE